VFEKTGILPQVYQKNVLKDQNHSYIVYEGIVYSPGVTADLDADYPTFSLEEVQEDSADITGILLLSAFNASWDDHEHDPFGFGNLGDSIAEELLGYEDAMETLANEGHERVDRKTYYRVVLSSAIDTAGRLIGSNTVKE
jgi:hypothetical protein